MKKTLLALALVIGLSSTSCLGPDRLYNSVKNWNAEVSSRDWVVESVFLGLHIIPVYSFALLVDVLIFNTLNYWSGTSPITDPGPFPGFTHGEDAGPDPAPAPAARAGESGYEG